MTESELGSYRGRLDALVLGCTHYPFMKKAMNAVLGETVDILDGGEGTARETRRRLSEAGLLTDCTDPTRKLIVENSSGDAEKYKLTLKLLEE